MFSRSEDRRLYITFAALAVAINLIDALLLRSAIDPVRRDRIAVAATFDVVVLVAGLYYWMLVRPGIRRPASTAIVALAGLLHATYFYPHATLLRSVLGGLCEAGLLAFVIVRIRRHARLSRDAGSPSDPLEAIRAAVAGLPVLPSLARLLTAELGVLYYALFSWRAKPHVPADAMPFSIHQRVGQADILQVFPIACALEIVPVHILLHQWSVLVAWLATGVSVYGAIWLVGLTRAFRLRPVLVGRDYLYLRYGLLFSLRVPKEMIAGVSPALPSDQSSAVPRKSQPRQCIHFTGPLVAEGAFGIVKQVDRVALTPDDETGFARALAQLRP